LMTMVSTKLGLIFVTVKKARIMWHSSSIMDSIQQLSMPHPQLQHKDKEIKAVYAVQGDPSKRWDQTKDQARCLTRIYRLLKWNLKIPWIQVSEWLNSRLLSWHGQWGNYKKRFMLRSINPTSCCNASQSQHKVTQYNFPNYMAAIRLFMYAAVGTWPDIAFVS
jgi:hypothetical protein